MTGFCYSRFNVSQQLLLKPRSNTEISELVGRTTNSTKTTKVSKHALTATQLRYPPQTLRMKEIWRKCSTNLQFNHLFKSKENPWTKKTCGFWARLAHRKRLYDVSAENNDWEVGAGTNRHTVAASNSGNRNWNLQSFCSWKILWRIFQPVSIRLRWGTQIWWKDSAPWVTPAPQCCSKQCRLWHPGACRVQKDVVVACHIDIRFSRWWVGDSCCWLMFVVHLVKHILGIRSWKWMIAFTNFLTSSSFSQLFHLKEVFKNREWKSVQKHEVIRRLIYRPCHLCLGQGDGRRKLRFLTIHRFHQSKKGGHGKSIAQTNKPRLAKGSQSRSENLKNSRNWMATFGHISNKIKTKLKNENI